MQRAAGQGLVATTLKNVFKKTATISAILASIPLSFLH
jgi:hypothetical protein